MSHLLMRPGVAGAAGALRGHLVKLKILVLPHADVFNYRVRPQRSAAHTLLY